MGTGQTIFWGICAGTLVKRTRQTIAGLDGCSIPVGLTAHRAIRTREKICTFVQTAAGCVGDAILIEETPPTGQYDGLALSLRGMMIGGMEDWWATRSTVVAARSAVRFRLNTRGSVVHLLSIDPGLASGASLWRFSDTQPAEMIYGWEIPGAYEGFASWLDSSQWAAPRLVVVAEKFITYPTKGHSPTLASTYPLVLEGVLIDRGLMPAQYPDPEGRWRRSSLQYWVDGADAKAKRKKQEVWLKENTDYYRTAGQLGVKHKDAQDYLSSVYHALSWFRSQTHIPTMERYWPDGR